MRPSRLLRFGGELGSKTLDGNVGVRVVQTDYLASGSARQPDWTQHPLLNNNGDPDFVAKWGTGAWLPNEFEDSYQDVLPSLNLRLKLNPELQLRFAASKAIARPAWISSRRTSRWVATSSPPTCPRIRTTRTLRRYRRPKW